MPTKNNSMNRRAFTLVEIMIVVIIVAVVWLGFISWKNAKTAERNAIKAAQQTGFTNN